MRNKSGIWDSIKGRIKKSFLTQKGELTYER